MGQDLFIQELNLMKNNTGDIQNSLPDLFLQTLVSQMKGQRNIKYHEESLIFSLSLQLELMREPMCLCQVICMG